jgi:hypothetical protein
MIALYKMIYKNPLAQIDPHPYFVDPSSFIFLITSSLGNRIYYTGGMHKRPDMEKEKQGTMW